MKIQYALMSCNSSPRYTGHWPTAAAAWLKLGITPVLFFIPNNPKHELPAAAGGIVHTVPPLRDVPIIIQTLMLRFWGSYLYPNATVMTCDINFVPLSNHFFTQFDAYPEHAYLHLQPGSRRHLVRDVLDQKLLHLDLIVSTSPYTFRSASNIPEQVTTINKLRHLNAWFHIAKGENMRRVLQLTPDWETTCKKTIPYYLSKDAKITVSDISWEGRLDAGFWFGDEIYTSIRLHHSDHQPIHYISYPSNRMRNHAKQDRYVGVHLTSIPYLFYKKSIEHLLSQGTLPKPTTGAHRMTNLCLRIIRATASTHKISMIGGPVILILSSLVWFGLRILPLPNRRILLSILYGERFEALLHHPWFMRLYQRSSKFIRSGHKTGFNPLE